LVDVYFTLYFTTALSGDGDGLPSRQLKPFLRTFTPNHYLWLSLLLLSGLLCDIGLIGASANPVVWYLALVN